MFNKATLFALAFGASAAFAQVTPTSPSGNTVVKAGDDLSAMWEKDTTGAWTDLEVQLMTGDNWNMVPLAVLGQNIDGTTQTELTVPCPQVTPNSKIYFLQFTQAGNVSTASWTTRFTIAAADGAVTDPTETTQPNGDQIGWGTGALIDASGGVSNGTTGTSSSDSSASVSVSSVSPSASSAASSVSSAEDSTTSDAASSSTSASPSSASSRSAAAAVAPSASPSSAASVNARGVIGAGWLALAAAFGAVLA